MFVLVRDNNIDQALRVLKKKLQREGVFREMKARRSYEKPSEKRAREKSEAVRRNRKQARKLAKACCPAPSASRAPMQGPLPGPDSKDATTRQPAAASCVSHRQPLPRPRRRTGPGTYRCAILALITGDRIHGRK